MRYCVFIIFLLSMPLLLSAQRRKTMKMMTSISLAPPYLKHNSLDSIAYANPKINLQKLSLKNTHIKNLAARYAVDHLRSSKEYDELYQDIRTLIYFMDNEYVRKAINYLRYYASTIKRRELAIQHIKEYLTHDSLLYYTENQEADSLDYILSQQNLRTLISFLEHDNAYQWLKEKGRDSIPLTLLTVGEEKKKIWLNNGKDRFHRIMTENLAGDTIRGWIKTSSKGNEIKIYLDEDVYQDKKIPDLIAVEEDKGLLTKPDSAYRTLQTMKIPSLRRIYWTYYLDVSFSFGQGYFSKNWSSGGENSLSLLSDIKYYLNYKKNMLSWENAFRYRLGALKSGDEKLSKNEDKFEILSKLGLQAYKHWNYAAQFDMNTVIFRSYNYPDQDEIIANFLSPGYFTISVGLDYKPKSNLSLYLSPIAGQWVYVRDTTKVDPLRYGIEEGKRFRSDAGAKIELRNNHEIAKFLKVDNRLTVFTSYYDKPEYIMLDWQVKLDFKINYYMKTSIYFNVLYDQDYSKKIQFKETLNLGVYFRF